MASIGACWDAILAWFRLNDPDGDRSLPGPASTAHLESIEAEFGVALPADLKETYLLHNGTGGIRGGGWFPYGRYMLSSAEVLQARSVYMEHVRQGVFEGMEATPEGPIKPIWWNSLWIPFTHSGSGDHHCVDLDPALGGMVGQVIDFSHESGARCVAAPSFAAWLEGFASDLEAGRYRYDAYELNILPVENG